MAAGPSNLGCFECRTRLVEPADSIAHLVRVGISPAALLDRTSRAPCATSPQAPPPLRFGLWCTLRWPRGNFSCSAPASVSTSPPPSQRPPRHLQPQPAWRAPRCSLRPPAPPKMAPPHPRRVAASGAADPRRGRTASPKGQGRRSPRAARTKTPSLETCASARRSSEGDSLQRPAAWAAPRPWQQRQQPRGLRSQWLCCPWLLAGFAQGCPTTNGALAI
mmetsp:Transcript_94282/g.236670  ORF Transcript_94282/g.236670 Transcript_94282/m.236670 type:complete len:220 (-) Transcript_94282:167-826(-)